MTEQFEKMMGKTARNINVGYLSALFDMAIESISKIAVDERIPSAIHKTINPMLDDMIDELCSMKNNTLATIMFEGGEETKVVQLNEKESEIHTPARDRAIGVHCKFTNIVGKQCFSCRHSEIIKNRPKYVVCNKLQMEIPSNYTCDKFDKYGQESE